MAGSSHSLLSDSKILAHFKQANIIIDPFKKENLGTVSYDVTLGEWYYQEQAPEPGLSSYSPWSKDDIARVWGKPKKAESGAIFQKRTGQKLPQGVSTKDLIIWIPPGETFLCHTKEFIGGRNIVTTMMKARSSLGRNFIAVCKCAGWGDVGYINRWTMEITNYSKYYTIPLVVGRRIAQIAFFEVDPTLNSDYSDNGKYQASKNIIKTKKDWKPEDMLPKMWKDREVQK